MHSKNYEGSDYDPDLDLLTISTNYMFHILEQWISQTK